MQQQVPDLILSVIPLDHRDIYANPNLLAKDIYLTFREGPVYSNEMLETTGSYNRSKWLSSRAELMTNFEVKALAVEPMGVLPVMDDQLPPRDYPIVVGW